VEAPIEHLDAVDELRDCLVLICFLFIREKARGRAYSR
jgi:hypothetical protein